MGNVQVGRTVAVSVEEDRVRYLAGRVGGEGGCGFLAKVPAFFLQEKFAGLVFSAAHKHVF